MLRTDETNRIAEPLLALAPEADIVGDARIPIRRCTSRVEELRRGDLFAAVVDGEGDGHDDTAEAVARGAAAILGERYVPTPGVPQLLVADSAATYARICQQLAGFPSREIKVVGVTGTRGKTTTAVLIQAVLDSGGRNSISWCDEGVYGADGRSPSRTVGADPAATAEWLRQGVLTGCTHAVMEFSSTDLARSRAAGIQIDTACITNVRSAHLEWHGTLRNYREAKAALLRQTADSGVAVFNVDDPGAVGLLQRRVGAALTVSLDNEAEVRAQIVESSLAEQTFLLSAGDETVAVSTRITGRRHVENCLVAAATGLLHGIELVSIAQGLSSVERLPGRFERLEFGRPYGVFLEESRDVEVVVDSLDVLRRNTRGNVVCVLDCVEWCGEHAGRIGRSSDVVFSPKSPESTRAQSILGATGELRLAADMEEAAVKAMEFASEGDCLLFVGGGCRPFHAA